ncbi:MAG: hypothetical protein ACK56I_34560, partial [bacterium]
EQVRGNLLLEQRHLVRDRLSKREQLLDSLAIFKLLDFEHVVLGVELRYRLFLVEQRELGIAQRLLQVLDLALGTQILPARAVLFFHGRLQRLDSCHIVLLK